MKTGRAKKIVTISILSVIIAITIATIVLAIIPKKFYNPIPDGYKIVTVYNNKESAMYKTETNMTDKEKEFKEKVDASLQSAFTDNVLSSMFQGTSKFEKNIVYETTSTNAMDKYANVSGSVCLIFNFLDEQKLMWNDKFATHPKAKGVDEETNTKNIITFTKIYMPLTVDNGKIIEHRVYLTGADNKSNFSIKYIANQTDLYKYISSLTWDVI